MRGSKIGGIALTPFEGETMKRVALLLLAVLVLSPALPAQEKAEPAAAKPAGIDIMKVSPADLVGADTQAFVTEATRPTTRSDTRTPPARTSRP